MSPARDPDKLDCYIKSICTRCDFYKDTEDELECAAFKILKELVKGGALSLDEIVNANIEEDKTEK